MQLEESEKVGLKLNIRKTKILASGPIISWQIAGQTMETVTDFIFLGYKITPYCDCSHEIKSRLLLGKKYVTNLDGMLKSRENAPEGIKRLSQSGNNAQLGMCLVLKEKSDVVKRNIA